MVVIIFLIPKVSMTLKTFVLVQFNMSWRVFVDEIKENSLKQMHRS